jgi:intracellular multiplication protein IcmE
MSNPKQRNIYFLSIGAAVVLVVGGIYVASKGNAPQANAGATVVEVPQVTAVPGSSTNGQYNKDVANNNLTKADQALENGKPFVPTLTNTQAITDVSPIDEIERQRKLDQEKAKLEQEKIAAEQEAARIAEERARQSMQPVQPSMPVTVNTMPVQQSMAVRAKTEKYSAEDALLIATLSGASHARASSSEFDFARQKPNKEMSVSNIQGETINQGSANGNVSIAPPYAKAGTVFNAILETSINSDEPSPVLAKIISGELKGTRLIGQIETVGKKVVIQFSTANMPNVNSSVKISAFAVNPITARAALADNVDNHYFLKYGVLLASTFVSGYADALRQNNTEYRDGIWGPIAIPKDDVSSKDINRQAIGSVGKAIATDAQQQLGNIKPTITVNSGSAIGILLVEDLVIKN